MSRQDMIERLTVHLYLGGNGLWSKVIVRKIVAEILKQPHRTQLRVGL